MIIGIDASRANREHKSGTEWYSFHLIKNLAHIDSKNQYILYTDKPLQGSLLDLTSLDLEEEKYQSNQVEFNKKGLQVIKSPHNNFQAKVLNWPFSFLWTQGRLSLEMLLKKPEVLFVPAHAIPLIHPKKTVTTIHDVAFEGSKKLFRQERLGAENKTGRKIINFLVRAFTFNKYGAYSLDYLKWSTRFAIRKAKKIIAVSNATKEEILETYQCPEEKIKVIYNGYNNLIYKKIIDPEKEKQVLEKYELKKPYLLYVGRIERKKNIPLLVESFAEARYNKKIQENLVLIGDAGYGCDEVRYILKEYDLEPVVFMPGWAEEADMPYIFNAATAFIFPSRREGFGIPILQAFGCEVPVTASFIPPFREIGGREGVLFFNPLDKKEMSQAIEKIILDDNLRQELVEKGKERVKNFSWRKCAQETLKELENI